MKPNPFPAVLADKRGVAGLPRVDATETPTDYFAALRERAAVPSQADRPPTLLTR